MSIGIEKIESFTAKYVVSDNGCWNWQADKVKGGYGRFFFLGKKCLAHRFSYTLFHGKIPEGLTIDHLCNNPSCVNPDHLRAATMKDNTLRGNSFSAVNSRKTHCHKGHPYHGENLYRYKDGRRDCRICMTERGKQYYLNNKEACLERARKQHLKSKNKNNDTKPL